jgi:hypothetical protein
MLRDRYYRFSLAAVWGHLRHDGGPFCELGEN